MERNVVIITILITLVLISVVQAVEIASVKNKITENNAQPIQGNDEVQSYDEMMAEMHPELAANKQTSSSANLGTMVGGC